MADLVKCRNCGADISGDCAAAVSSALDGWESGGLIGAEQAERLRRSARAGARTQAPGDGWMFLRNRLTPGLILLVIGGLLVTSAVAMVVAQFWGDLGRYGRLLTVAAPTVGLYAAGGAVLRRGPALRPAALLLLFFGAALVPFCAWLLVAGVPLVLDVCCDLLGLPHSDPARAFATALLTLVVHLATLWRVRSPIFTLPASISWLYVLPCAAEWLAPDRRHGATLSGAIFMAGLALLAGGAVAAKRGKGAYAVVPDIVGSLCSLLALTVLGAELAGWWEVLALAGPVALIAAGCDPRRQRYLPAGMLFLVLNIFRVGLERFRHTAGLPITLLLCGIAAIAAGYAVHRVRQEYTTD